MQFFPFSDRKLHLSNNSNADEFREELRANNIDLDTGEEEWRQVHHSYHPSSPHLSPLITTSLTPHHHSSHPSSPHISPLITTSLTPHHHSSHPSSPQLSSPLITTALTPHHRISHPSSPQLSPLITASLTPHHHSSHPSSPQLSPIITTVHPSKAQLYIYLYNTHQQMSSIIRSTAAQLLPIIISTVNH